MKRNKFIEYIQRRTRLTNSGIKQDNGTDRRYEVTISKLSPTGELIKIYEGRWEDCPYKKHRREN